MIIPHLTPNPNPINLSTPSTCLPYPYLAVVHHNDHTVMRHPPTWQSSIMMIMLLCGIGISTFLLTLPSSSVCCNLNVRHAPRLKPTMMGRGPSGFKKSECIPTVSSPFAYLGDDSGGVTEHVCEMVVCVCDVAVV